MRPSTSPVLHNYSSDVCEHFPSTTRPWR